MALRKRTPRESLKSLSWIYIILAALVILLGVVFSLVPNIAEKVKEVTDIENPMLYIYVTLAVHVLLYVWYFYLARRFADGKSNGTLYIVLLILGLVGGIVSAFMGQTQRLSSMDFIIDVVALWFVYKIKKEEK